MPRGKICGIVENCRNTFEVLYESRTFAELKPKIREVGLQHGVINRVRNLITNSKPNPERLLSSRASGRISKAVTTKLPVVSFVICPEYIYTPESEALVRQFAGFVDAVYVVSAKTFDRLSEQDKPDGLLSICRFPVRRPEDLELPENACVVVLDGLEIPATSAPLSAPATARTWTRCSCATAARGFRIKVVKGSMGAAFRIRIVEFTDGVDCAAWLRERGFAIYLADTRAGKPITITLTKAAARSSWAASGMASIVNGMQTNPTC